MRPFLAAALVVIAVSACGGKAGHRTTSRTTSTATIPAARIRTLNLYSSLPLKGPSELLGHAAQDGIRLALAQVHGHAGQFRIRYSSLDDTGTRGGLNIQQTLSNASQAATDSRSAYFIGELNHQATQLSAKVIADARIPQVSLVAGPFKNRPRTLLALLPGDTAQADAMAIAIKQGRCAHVALASENSTGEVLRGLISTALTAEQIKVSDSRAISGNYAALTNYSVALKSRNVDCFVYVGEGVRNATEVATVVHDEIPRALIFGTSSVCGNAWTTSAPPLLCTSPLLPVAKYPGGAAFASEYKQMFGIEPQSAYALYGYEAAQLFVKSVTALGPRGDVRAALLRRLLNTPVRSSALGPYAFDASGDATIKYYGLYTITNGAAPKFDKRLDLAAG